MDEKIQRLKDQNPFVSSSVGNPWEEQYPDVDSINQAAFNGIANLIDQKTRSPLLPCAGLVFGEIGSGKTHLISRILRYKTQASRSFSFAYVQPIEDVSQTYRYLLREVIVNLCYSSGSGKTQLDKILDNLFNGNAENLPVPVKDDPQPSMILDEFQMSLKHVLVHKKISRALINHLVQLVVAMLTLVLRPEPVSQAPEDPIKQIQKKFPEIPKRLLHVLFQYQKTEKRSAVIEWLKGSPIDEADADLLNVPDRISDSTALLEQEALHILEGLGMLMAYYGQPLVICFDRLENYDTDAKIHSLGAMVEFLVDRTKAMLPLVFVRGDRWYEVFLAKLNHHVTNRLETNSFTLKGCNKSQVYEIIKTRLTFVLGKNSENPFFPFDEDKLNQLFPEKFYIPRQVIMKANKQLNKLIFPEEEILAAPPVSFLDKLRQSFESYCQTVRQDFDRHPPDRNRLKRSLELYLKHAPQDNILIQGIAEPEDRFIDFECVAGGRSAMFIIDLESNHSSVMASLKRGVKFLQNNSLGKAIYIRDERCKIPAPPKWEQTNKTLETFKSLGGHVIFLDMESAVCWYALTCLTYDMYSGDLSLADGDAVSLEQLAEFVQKEIHTNQMMGFGKITRVLRS